MGILGLLYAIGGLRKATGFVKVRLILIKDIIDMFFVHLMLLIMYRAVLKIINDCNWLFADNTQFMMSSLLLVLVVGY